MVLFKNSTFVRNRFTSFALLLSPALFFSGFFFWVLSYAGSSVPTTNEILITTWTFHALAVGCFLLGALGWVMVYRIGRRFRAAIAGIKRDAWYVVDYVVEGRLIQRGSLITNGSPSVFFKSIEEFDRNNPEHRAAAERSLQLREEGIEERRRQREKLRDATPEEQVEEIRRLVA